jgi:hypothetical protein
VESNAARQSEEGESCSAHNPQSHAIPKMSQAIKPHCGNTLQGQRTGCQWILNDAALQRNRRVPRFGETRRAGECVSEPYHWTLTR